MQRKQRKSLPWRRFGYVILIIIKFSELLALIFSKNYQCFEKLHQTLKEYFIRYPNTLKLVKKIQLCLVFSTQFSMFGYLIKHSSLCLKYYFKNFTLISICYRFIMLSSHYFVYFFCLWLKIQFLFIYKIKQNLARVRVWQSFASLWIHV